MRRRHSFTHFTGLYTNTIVNDVKLRWVEKAQTGYDMIFLNLLAHQGKQKASLLHAMINVHVPLLKTEICEKH